MSQNNTYEILWDIGEKTDIAKIKFLDGKYKNLIYSYLAVGFDEREDGSGVLKFSYSIHENPYKKIDNDFITILGDILTEIILEKNIDNRESDSIEPDSQ